jgi:hypothetical protein
MQPTSLAIVLPAYGEAGRLGPALDELFGYLRRHGAHGRDGAPGAAALPADLRVLVVASAARTFGFDAFAWFAVWREWRSLAIALGVTAALVAVSIAIDGGLWVSWLRDSLWATAEGAPLNQFSVPVPLWIRGPAALALRAWGGLTDRRWTVPTAATLALPVLWPSGFAVLTALRPIWREQLPGAPE